MWCCMLGWRRSSAPTASGREPAVRRDGGGPTINVTFCGTHDARFGRLTRCECMDDSDVQRGPVDELLDVAADCPTLDQLEVEGGRTLEDRGQPGLTGDHWEERHLHAVDQAGGPHGPVHRQTAVRAQRYLGLLLEPGDDVDGV